MTTRHPGLIPSHPGEILRDALDAIDLSKVEVARRLGISRQTLYDILNERMAVTPEMAVRLGALFGNGAGIWAGLQVNHDLAIAEREVDVSGIETVKGR